MESTAQMSNDPGTARERERNAPRTESNPDRADDGRLMYYEHQLDPMTLDGVRQVLRDIVDVTTICDLADYPLPPAGLPGFLHTQVSYTDPAAHLIEIGIAYVRAVALSERRAMHHRWREAADFIAKIEQETEERVYRQVFAEQERKAVASRDRQKVYFIGAAAGPIKIGVSVSPQSRLSGLQTSHHERLSILATVAGDAEVERAYHTRFAAHRLSGEWFERCPEILAEIECLLNHGVTPHEQ